MSSLREKCISNSISAIIIVAGVWFVSTVSAHAVIARFVQELTINRARGDRIMAMQEEMLGMQRDMSQLAKNDIGFLDRHLITQRMLREMSASLHIPVPTTEPSSQP